MERFLAFPLEQIPFVVIALVLGFTFHEFAHAYAAYKFGDPTAKNQGRLTLSPLAHLDPFGTILLFIAGFGWARPVPVNRFYFKNPRLAGVVVSLAGPVSNLIIAFVFYLLWNILLATGIAFVTNEFVYQTFDMIVRINVMLFVFNLLPFPPLDGYRIIEDLMPPNIRAKMTQYEKYGALIFLILVFTPLDQYTIYPIFHTVIPAVFNMLEAAVSWLF
ncbi:site-2 protease family protein [Bacillus sp. HMF5848]|uniref:site-2 protease family protein n=1 Tax=Bacillus sp. HMF5848 TaxID=2495421 RepID=UPI000F77CEEB|nr:site-2 protease family protein [Bacillus sp. HMF5848]RSK28991.1 site-2 protease family protein [Bacillus sp. HMF5848]